MSDAFDEIATAKRIPSVAARQLVADLMVAYGLAEDEAIARMRQMSPEECLRLVFAPIMTAPADGADAGDWEAVRQAEKDRH